MGAEALGARRAAVISADGHPQAAAADEIAHKARTWDMARGRGRLTPRYDSATSN
jgi:hypothetical protein